MTIYYVKQDNTVWGCGDPSCCGEYYEEIDEKFHECDCKDVESDMVEHLQICMGGGPVLKWREAKKIEVQAFRDGKYNGFSEGFESGIEYQKKKENK